MITDITKQFSSVLAKKIFANAANAHQYLLALDQIQRIEALRDGKGVLKKNIPSPQLWGLVVATWDYQVAKPIIRNMFRSTGKYTRGQEANHAVGLLRQEWERLQLGAFEWPFSQGDFDNFVQRVNASYATGEEKDTEVKEAAVKFRRIKEINTYRNDYIETLIFEYSDTILPTLRHARGVDFFINGISFDQKVSRSVTNEFKKKHGDQWREKAIENPIEVAEFLYSLQDEGRFGADPRLLIVYVDEDVSADRIEMLIRQADFTHPKTVSFLYRYKDGKEENHSTPCIVILLHN